MVVYICLVVIWAATQSAIVIDDFYVKLAWLRFWILINATRCGKVVEICLVSSLKFQGCKNMVEISQNFGPDVKRKSVW